MPDYLSLSKKQPAFPDYLDFQVLRRIGIEQIQALSSKIWTDFNLHDPGVTVLEVLCYAVTDLGYRNNFDIKDLLTLNPQDPKSKETNFFTPDQILTCNPVTELDWRKRLIDIAGVRNAWLEKVEIYEPTIYVDAANGRLQYEPPSDRPKDKALRLNPKGLYRVCLDLDLVRRTDACGQIYRSWDDILQEVKAVLCSDRNLGEDFYDVMILGEEEIGLCTDIELESGADPEDVQVEIYVRVQAFLAPRLRFYTLQELLSQGKTLAEIFAGRPSPLHDETTRYQSHGFIDTTELEALELPKIIHTSDLYQIIMDVPGVTAIKKMSVINYINGLPQSKGHPWYLYLTPKHRPVLGVAQSKVTFFNGDLPFKADGEEVERRYYEQQTAYIKAPQDDFNLDLPVPQGSYFDLADHYSIHHDFPLTYGVGEDGLPDTATPLRKAQAKQLKGYLIFFDQILANYLAQLAHVRELFSWEKESDRQQHIHLDSQKNYQELFGEQNHKRTYFTRALTNIPDAQDIIRNYRRCAGSELPSDVVDANEFIDYIPWLEAISEDSETYQDRRNRFLDHLLARFAETFTDYVLLNYRVDGIRRDEANIIDDKVRFLQDYPTLSRDRFRAFNYCNCDEIWNTNNVSGFQKRVSRLLGIDFDNLTQQNKLWRRSLSHYQVEHQDEYLFKISRSGETSPLLTSQQTYKTEQIAQVALSTLLEAAVNPLHYRRLSYRYFYHYGWNVSDRQGNLLVAYDRTFPSQAERDDALEPLLALLRRVLLTTQSSSVDTPTEVSRYIQIKTDEDGHYHFQLIIPNPDSESPIESNLTFTSISQYVNETDAMASAKVALTQITNQDSTQNAYRKSRVSDDTTIDKNSTTPAKFTHYGYGIIDNSGALLVESPDRFTTTEERDESLQRCLSYLQANQNSLWVQPSTDCFFVELKDRTGDRTILRTIDGVSTKAQAQEQLQQPLLSNGKNRSAYSLINENENDFSFFLRINDNIPFAQNPSHYATAIERELYLEALLYYLNRVPPASRIEGETGTYRATLLDRSGNPLLITTHSYSTQSQAEAAYQRLLYLAADPVYFQPTSDRPSELPYGLELVDRRGNVFATHPNHYPSSCQRDLVIRSIINYVNEDIERRLVSQDAGVYYELIDQSDTPLLVGAIAYVDIATANVAFDQMLTLARERANYQLIDNAAGHCPFSFTLYSGTNLIANHPDHYDTAAERDQALQALINLVISDRPLYRIDGDVGHFTYALVDILANTEDSANLLTSTNTYPDAEVAQSAFIQMLSQAALPERYRRLDRLSVPQPFGFELLDESSEILARHLNIDGNPKGYATEAERDAAIEKIIYYTAQPEIRSAIVNPEGSFFAEVRDEGGNLIWIGRQNFPDQQSAQAEADRIHLLAKQQEHYLPTNTEIGICHYTFALKDQTDVVIADHFGFYESETERDRQIQQLWRRFSGKAAFVQIQEKSNSESGVSIFTFEISAQLLCLFQDCDAGQQQVFQAGAILSSPEKVEFATAGDANTAFSECLKLALKDQNFVREYKNQNIDQECNFTFSIHATTKRVVATSRVYQSHSEMEKAIAFIQQIARGWKFNPTTAGTCCGYYFFVAIPDADNTPLKSLNRYPTKERAWQAAGVFVGNLRHRDRYIRIPVNIPDQSYGLGITDATGNLLATSSLERDLDEVFRQLNSGNQLDAVTELLPRKYWGKIDDEAGQPLLQGTQRFETGEQAWEHGNTLVELAQTNTQTNTNFRLIDDQDGNCLYSWELTNTGKDQILAIPLQTFSSADQRDAAIAKIQARINDEGFHLVEHILLRPKHLPIESIDDEDDIPLNSSDSQENEESNAIADLPRKHLPTKPDNFLPIAKMPQSSSETLCSATYDPYSFWASVILPCWTSGFRDMNFRRLVERTLRLEAPAHIALKICWVNIYQMHEFEVAYRHWLEQLALESCQDASCDLIGSLNHLLDILSHLNNVYPEGTLHDCDESGSDDNPIVLNQTVLGTARE